MTDRMNIENNPRRRGLWNQSLFRQLSHREAQRARSIAYEAARAVLG
jgi:hypothetical protein